MSLRRAVLVNQADTLRFALFARTSDWLADESATQGPQTAPESARWRTPAGLRVRLTQDFMLGRPVLELDADDDIADAEAQELERQLPRVFQIAGYQQVRQALADAVSPADRSRLLPLLAVTVAGRGEASRAEVADAAAAGLTSAEGQERAAAVLAAAYLDDIVLLAQAHQLASGDPDSRVRALAERVTRRPPAGQEPSEEPESFQSDGLRRIAFMADRVREEFLPFAARRGWELAAHQSGGQEDSERFTWQPEPGIEVSLIADVRLDRELVTLLAAEPTGHPTLDQIEGLIRERFETVDLDEALDILADETDGPDRIMLLKVVAAAAPASYRPHFLITMAEVFASPATPVRGFAVGTSIYFPWPEIVPFLAWIALYDRELAVRSVAKIALDTVTNVQGDRLARLVPSVRYHSSDAGSVLIRQVQVMPQAINQRLGADLLWHSTRLPDGFPAGYRELSFEEAGQLAGVLAAGQGTACDRRGEGHDA